MLSFVTPGYHSDNIKATQTSQLDNYNAQWLLHIIRMQKVMLLNELSKDISFRYCVLSNLLLCILYFVCACLHI